MFSEVLLFSFSMYFFTCLHLSARLLPSPGVFVNLRCICNTCSCPWGLHSSSNSSWGWGCSYIHTSRQRWSWWVTENLSMSVFEWVVENYSVWRYKGNLIFSLIFCLATVASLTKLKVVAREGASVCFSAVWTNHFQYHLSSDHLVAMSWQVEQNNHPLSTVSPFLQQKPIGRNDARRCSIVCIY